MQVVPLSALAVSQPQPAPAVTSQLIQIEANNAPGSGEQKVESRPIERPLPENLLHFQDLKVPELLTGNNIFRNVLLYSSVEDAVANGNAASQYCGLSLFYIPRNFILTGFGHDQSVETKPEPKGESVGQYPLDEKSLTAGMIRRIQWPKEVVMIAEQYLKVSGAGGKRNRGENPLMAAVRECKEEFGVHLHPSCVWYAYSTVNRASKHVGHVFYAVTRDPKVFNEMLRCRPAKSGENEWSENIVKLPVTYSWTFRDNRHYGLPIMLSDGLLSSRLNILLVFYQLRLMEKPTIKLLFEQSLHRQFFKPESRQSSQYQFEWYLFDLYFGDNVVCRRMELSDINRDIRFHQSKLRRVFSRFICAS